MKSLKKSAEIMGQVFRLVSGGNVETAASEMLKRSSVILYLIV